MSQLHRDNGGYTGIDVRDTADLWFDNVSLLLQPAAGDTVIEDKSPNAHSITNNGVTLDNTNQKWNGAASMLFERANSDYLTTSNSNDWFFGKFDLTIEFFLQLGSIGTDEIHNVTSQDTGNDVFSVRIQNKADQGFTFNYANGTKLFEGSDRTSPTASFGHFAATRQGDLFTLWFNGSQVAQTTDGVSTQKLSEPLDVGRISRNGGQEYLDGNMTSLRITKGVARYTAAFTPPTRPFPTRRYVSGVIQP